MAIYSPCCAAPTAPKHSTAPVRKMVGRSWSDPEQITQAHQHPADLVRLSNGDILLTYGNRNPPYRIEGRISRDGGRSWLDCLLTFSGHLYGYAVEESPPHRFGLSLQRRPRWKWPGYHHVLLQSLNAACY